MSGYPSSVDRACAQVEVSVVIPCLNEALTLPYVLKEIEVSLRPQLGDALEVIVADNGSTDQSRDVALALGARVVEVPARGYGSALQGGIAAANGRLIVMGDADGSYAFADALPMLQHLRDGADLVMGDRFRGGIAPGAMPPLHRYLGNPVLSWLGRRLFRSTIRDFHCGIRAFRRDAIADLGLVSPGMEYASEMVLQAERAKLRVEQVPVRLLPDLRNRPPHLRTWRDGWRHLRFMLAHSPSWVFLLPAVVTALAACLSLGISAFGPVQAGSVELSYRTAMIGGFLAVASASVSWSFLIARATLGLGQRRIAYGTEISLSVCLFAVTTGVVLLVRQLDSWSASGFGEQSLESALLPSLTGSLLVTLGVVSASGSLLLGLVRSRAA